MGAFTRTALLPSAKYLVEHGVNPKDFNSYGSHRGNYEVMMRGTFGNIRIVNKLLEGEVDQKQFIFQPERNFMFMTLQ